MKTKLTNRPVEQVIAAIEALNLDPIKLKLMDPEEGQGWSREYADRMELAYKRLLTLMATHPEETLAPSKDVDRFWHGHILDTLKYAEDCDKVFGCFLHHFPYFGMRGAEDAANLAKAGETTRRLYQQEFGQDHEASVSSKAENAAYCGAIRAEAYCGAISAKDVAYCGAIKAEKPAYCGAISAKDVAYCGAIKAEKPAYCGAIKAENPAYCGAIRAENPAYCGAISAYCGAITDENAIRSEVARTSDKLKVSLRPSLPAVL
jgi:hypothetical protein